MDWIWNGRSIQRASLQNSTLGMICTLDGSKPLVGFWGREAFGGRFGLRNRRKSTRILGELFSKGSLGRK